MYSELMHGSLKIVLMYGEKKFHDCGEISFKWISLLTKYMNGKFLLKFYLSLSFILLYSEEL